MVKEDDLIHAAPKGLDSIRAYINATLILRCPWDAPHIGWTRHVFQVSQT